MKKVLTILCGVIAVMLLAFPTQASNFNDNVNHQSIEAIQSGALVLGPDYRELDAQTINRILYMAAIQLNIPFNDILDLNSRGLVTIVQVDYNTFHVQVNNGEPNIAIVVLDLL